MMTGHLKREEGRLVMGSWVGRGGRGGGTDLQYAFDMHELQLEILTPGMAARGRTRGIVGGWRREWQWVLG